MIKAVLFDFFGVLYPDTLWGLADVFIPERTDEQKQALRDIVTRSDVGMINADEFWKEASAVYGVSVEQALKQRQKLGGVDKQLLQLIRELRSKGIQTGILSNIGVGYLDSVFVSEDSSEYFDQLILSGEVGVVKPNPRIFEIAVERLGVEYGECLFFDDSPLNIEGARAAGMHAELYEGIAGCKAAMKSAGVDL